jgi:ADP-ribose pyrophosphatase
MPEKTIKSEVVFKGRAVTLRVDTVKMPDGRETTREIVEHADCVAIIPVDAQGNILLVKQYRKAVDQELLEIPAGGIDPDETPEEAVRREMQEETGYLPQKIEKMGGFFSTPGYCREYLYLYQVSDLKPSRLHAEDTDDIHVVPTPPSKIPVMIESGVICDAKSIAGLMMYLSTHQSKK